MRAYQVSAVGSEGRIVVIATTDTASEALAKFRDTLTAYPHAWVTDETSMDVSIFELMRRAEDEHKSL